MESREEDEAFIEMPTDEDFEKTRFQIFHQTKQYELSQQVYPICIQECVRNSDPKRKAVFLQEELTCANNCVNKYRKSLQLLLSYMSLTEARGLPQQQ